MRSSSSARPGRVPRGDALLDLIRATHAEFAAGRDEAARLTTCTCGACTRAGSLDLKFVVHAGKYVLQDIAGSRELTGLDVVLAHRLLKNHAAEAVGTGAYLLVTDAAARTLDVPIEGRDPDDRDLRALRADRHVRDRPQRQGPRRPLTRVTLRSRGKMRA